tara:strand:- start:410 stop:793 length:384 start_codon:yes stop_codon:yes gene_type:complete
MKNIKTSSNKSFGIVFFIVFTIISLFPLVNKEDIRIWSLVIALIFLILTLFNSKALTPMNKLWTRFGFFLGNFISPFVMGVIFFFVVTPIGLLMRLFGKDVLNLKINKSNTYWIKKTNKKSSMEKQF